MSLVLHHSPAEIIRQLLIDMDLGSLPGTGTSSEEWPVYFNSEPDAPDDVITVYHTTGQIDGRSTIDGEIWEHYGWMLRVRSTRASLAYAKAADVAKELAEMVLNQLVTIGLYSYIVYAVNRRGSIINAGKEAPTSERNVYTLNAISAISRTT